jgi:hypothetical protein
MLKQPFANDCSEPDGEDKGNGGKLERAPRSLFLRLGGRFRSHERGEGKALLKGNHFPVVSNFLFGSLEEGLEYPMAPGGRSFE